MRVKIDNRKDILLLLLWSPGESNLENEPIAGRTRIVKALFLFRKEVLSTFSKGTAVTEENFYDFFPWSFGPFSTQVYDDITFFILRKYIEATVGSDEPLVESREEWEKYISETEMDFSTSEAVDEFAEESFRLSDKGLTYVREELVPQLSIHQRELLRIFKRKIQSSLRSLLRYTYEQYPDYTTKSEIKEKVMSGGR